MVKYLIFISLLLLLACGIEGSTDSGLDDDSASQTINTQKLIGTPFEGKSSGDEFEWSYFLCGDYRTETIDELPIKIFTAFFTLAEEEIILEGITIVNEAIGSTETGGVFYEVTDIWSDDVRVMYKVDSISDNNLVLDAKGFTRNVESRFNNKHYSETIMADWSIELLDPIGINSWTVAHELGHASGIAGHYLIDYTSDSISSLEDHSLMGPTSSLIEPILTQYTYMMQQQGMIIQSHLHEEGNMGGENCQ